MSTKQRAVFGPFKRRDQCTPPEELGMNGERGPFVATHTIGYRYIDAAHPVRRALDYKGRPAVDENEDLLWEDEKGVNWVEYGDWVVTPLPRSNPNK